MFQKSGNNNTGRYDNVHPSGTNYLRHTVNAMIYSGDQRVVDKLTNAQLFWKFYNNKHWAQNNDELLSFNYIRAIVDKVNNFMIGKDGFEVNVVDSFGDEIAPELETAYEMMGNFIFGGEDKKSTMQDVLQMGSITGDAYVFLEVVATKIKVRLLDTRMVVPKFRKGDSADVESYRVVKQLGTNDQKYIQKISEYSKENVTTYYLKETGEDAQKFEFTSETNTFGEIPIVHIRNLPKSDAYGGRADIEDIIKINKTYNEMAVDYKMIVDYYAEPTTVITGGTVGNLKRGAGNIWSGLPSDSNVFNLTLNEDLGATTNFLQLLKNAMHDLSGVPEEVLSKVQHISNTSAAALQMLYQPIIQVSDNKAVGYGKGFAEIIQMGCKMYAKYKADHPLFVKIKKEIDKLEGSDYEGDNVKNFFDRYIPRIMFKYNLPNDRLSALNEAAIELSNQLASRHEIMERLGKQNIPKIQSEIKEDRQEALDYETKLAEVNKPPVPIAGGNPPQNAPKAAQ